MSYIFKIKEAISTINKIVYYIDLSSFVHGKITMPFNSPSLIAEIVSGQSKNGWSFFEGLNELRTLDQEQGE